MPNSQELNAHGFSTWKLDDSGIPQPPEASSPEVYSEASYYPDSEPVVYGALKCYFYTPKRGDIWGAFCVLFNGVSGEVVENVFWVTRMLAGPAIDVNAEWRLLNKQIPKMGSYEKVLGDKLSVMLIEAFTTAARIQLCRSGDHSNLLHEVSEEIRNGFERATHCFLEFTMAFERMSAQDLAQAGVLAKESGLAEPETTIPEEKSFVGTLVNCLPIIDPVYGKPVSELEPGDMLKVKIQGGIGAGDMLQRFLESTNQEAIFPIESVERTTVEKTYIFLNINAELKGLVTVTKDLRLRVMDVKGEKRTSININMDNVILFGVIAASFVVIAYVIRFLLF